MEKKNTEYNQKNFPSGYSLVREKKDKDNNNYSKSSTSSKKSNTYVTQSSFEAQRMGAPNK